MLNIDKLKIKEWNDSYDRGENHFYKPCDELVRFVSHYLRRRTSWTDFADVLPGAKDSRVLDVGCGIGRNLIFGSEWGFEMYGNDLSAKAVEIACEWLEKKVTQSNNSGGSSYSLKKFQNVMKSHQYKRNMNKPLSLFYKN